LKQASNLSGLGKHSLQFVVGRAVLQFVKCAGLD